MSLADGRVRIRIFVDFWNFSLSARDIEPGFMMDWSNVGPSFSAEVAALVVPGQPYVYEAMHVYGSYDPHKTSDVKLKNWFLNTLDRMPGVHVTLAERQKKRGYPKCPHCQEEVMKCPSCEGDMRGTEEKGVDTKIVTDMISLAWIDAYDIALLVSADRDFVPVAEFLQTKGIKVIHGCFPPKGNELSRKCWGLLDLGALRETYRQIAKN
ncbi:hypothetical protein CKO11_10235 [Rhodobacter sp. TJ_12]|uniref:NYN domain-containing protein n=1 Tax=Rhodobacter sp. TJ_12 TaxID=2029399 RepID=UPI001CBCE0C9|nr:NYN domain-containing protein [Rhodobacter sp. TJ_12]MBZ4022837.1 hypothetical protein [Rhodobacter sp. TJ_12]